MNLPNLLACLLALIFAVSCKSPDRGQGPWNSGVKMGTIESLEKFERKVVAAVERYVAEEMPGLPIKQLGTPSLSDRAPSENKEKWPLDFRVSYRKPIRLTDSEINKWWDIFDAIGKQQGIADTDDEPLAELNRLEPAERAAKLRSLIGEGVGKELKEGAPGVVMATFVAYDTNKIQGTYLGIGAPIDD